MWRLLTISELLFLLTVLWTYKKQSVSIGYFNNLIGKWLPLTNSYVQLLFVIATKNGLDITIYDGSKIVPDCTYLLKECIHILCFPRNM